MSGAELLTVAQVAERLGVTAAHVRLLIRRRELRATDLGVGAQHTYRVRQADVEALVEARSTMPPTPVLTSKLERLRAARR